MKILHIISKTNDADAMATALRQREDLNLSVKVLFLQDAVFTRISGDGGDGVFACREDAATRGVKTDASLVEYEDIVKMLLDADSVVCW